MTLLTMAQDVCDEIGLPRPASVVNATDQLGRQIFGLAKREVAELSKRYNWPVLVRDYSFVTVAGTASYSPPADFRALIGDSAYSMSEYVALRGSVASQEWQRMRGLNLSSLSRTRFRIYGSPSQIVLTPTPDDTDTLVFEYVSNMYVKSDADVEKATFTQDTDSPLMDESLVGMGLRWRLKHAKGLDFGLDQSEYESVIAREYARSLGSPAITIGGRMLSDVLGPTDGFVPENGFGA